MKRILWLFLLLAVLVPLSAGQAIACSCVQIPPKQVARDADVVLTGVTTSSDGDPLEVSTSTFAVEVVYEGDIIRGSEINIRHQTQEPSCGVTFEEGKRYTVFAYQAHGNLWTNSCWPRFRGAWANPSAFGLQEHASPARFNDEPGLELDAADGLAILGVLMGFGLLARLLVRRTRRA